MTARELLVNAKERAHLALDAGDRTRAICIMSAAIGRARCLTDAQAAAILSRIVQLGKQTADIRAWLDGIELKDDGCVKLTDTQK